MTQPAEEFLREVIKECYGKYADESTFDSLVSHVVKRVAEYQHSETYRIYADRQGCDISDLAVAIDVAKINITQAADKLGAE